MIHFILNNEHISTGLPGGMTLLDFIRYQKNLKGTKIGCREGDCGACNVLIGELRGNEVVYRSMTSCLTPLANANLRHVVTVEGINPADGGLSPVQKAIVENNGTQCGFCTPGFVVSLTGFCLGSGERSPDSAVAAIDGNICRCTGYKSLERAAASLCSASDGEGAVVPVEAVPPYFDGIRERLAALAEKTGPAGNAAGSSGPQDIVGGGTDLYVQRPEELLHRDSRHVLFDEGLRGVRSSGGFLEIGASSTVTDLLESELFRARFVGVEEHIKLVSSTPIRNMATIAGNFVNASPIGDMTVWFLALDAEVVLESKSAQGPDGRSDQTRTVPLRDLYLGYKQLDMRSDEFISLVRFAPGFTHFNFEKVCKRKCLDIATVNTAISVTLDEEAKDRTIREAHVSAGGVAPVPLYLRKTSEFLAGRTVSADTVRDAAGVMQSEISPISDVRGSARYKRLLLRQLFYAHFFEMFGTDPDQGR